MLEPACFECDAVQCAHLCGCLVVCDSVKLVHPDAQIMGANVPVLLYHGCRGVAGVLDCDGSVHEVCWQDAVCEDRGVLVFMHGFDS